MTSRIAKVAALAAVTVSTGVIGYFRILTGFRAYDDEGTILVSLKLFLEHGGLYDQVVAQYGPFYYEFWGGLLSLLGIPVSHDVGRFLTLAVWVAAAAAVGIVTLRVLRSVTLALIAQLMTFSALGTVAYEPLHPGSLTCLLLATTAVVSSFVGAQPTAVPAAVIGAVAAMLLLIKVNVGGFAIAALVLAVATTHPSFGSRRALRVLIEVGFITLPLVLMNRQLVEHAWVRCYALHVMLAACGVVVWLRRGRSGTERAQIDLRWLVTGFLVVAVLGPTMAILTGTSPGGLLRGMVLTPAGQAEGFALPLELPAGIVALDVVAVAGALEYAWIVRDRRRELPPGATMLVSAARLVVGVAMAVTPLSHALELAPDVALSMLAFVWVALLPPPGPGAEDGMLFARRFLPALTSLQALHAFPVAGSQVAWASFLLVPLGVITAADGARGVTRAVGSPVARRWLGHAGRVLTIALLLLVTALTRRELRDHRRRYDRFVPLDLPGARLVRVAKSEAWVLRSVTAALGEDCGNFLTLPGMSSFYLWTGKDPPSLNPAGFLTLFGVEEQRRVIAAVEGQRDLCLLKNPLQMAFWGMGRLPTRQPLYTFMGREFVFSERFGSNYQLWRRRTDRK